MLGVRAPRSDEILRSLTTAVVALDESLRITYLNTAAQTLLGLSERQSLGHELGELMSPADEIVDLCQRALRTGLTFGMREFAARVGEHELQLDCRAAPMENAPGLLLELLDTQRDKLVRREAELAAQQKLSRQMVRQLAHEVKNPLGGMRGAAQLLERRLISAEQKRYTQVIIDEVDRLASLVDSLLKPGSAPRPEWVNLHEITEHVADLLAAEKPAQLELLRDYDPSLPPLSMDRNQLIQAYLNLARNALQALGHHGRLVLRTRALSNFTLRGRQHRLVVSAEVEDNGPGIPAELQETVFYPLVTGKSKGTGLGLTIAQELVAQNGGLIEFTSVPGRTVFKIRLPVPDSQEVAA